MNYPLLNIAPLLIAVTVAAGISNRASAETLVTEEQADEIAAAAVEESDMQIVQTVIVSAPDEPPVWFPTLTEQDLTIEPLEMRVTAFASPAAGQDGDTTVYEHTAIPLPPAAWTGLTGLASLAAVRRRKAIKRFFT